MISEKMQDALNGQINEEMYSSYLYLQMSGWFEAINLPGFANWMYVQSQEETVHAMKIFRYLTERGGKVALQEIKAPPQKWAGPLAAFEAAYAHEQHISRCFTKLTALARELADNAAEIFLQWYVTEQVEEEANADEIVKKLNLMADAPGGMFMLDRELAARVFVPPPQESQ
ncbi:MAG: ferritin [Planctomycetota bacterium]|jgi:ferritin